MPDSVPALAGLGFCQTWCLLQLKTHTAHGICSGLFSVGAVYDLCPDPARVGTMGNAVLAWLERVRQGLGSALGMGGGFAGPAQPTGLALCCSSGPWTGSGIFIWPLGLHEFYIPALMDFQQGGIKSHIAAYVPICAKRWKRIWPRCQNWNRVCHCLYSFFFVIRSQWAGRLRKVLYRIFYNEVESEREEYLVAYSKMSLFTVRNKWVFLCSLTSQRCIGLCWLPWSLLFFNLYYG